MLKAKLADLPRPILHLGCGSSRVGDIRLDAFHPGADLKGDAERTPFKDAVAGTVCMDPPFTEAHLLKRQAWATEAVRLLRVGGMLVLHAPWMLKRPTLELVEVHVRDDSTYNMLPGPPICLSIYRKLRDGERRD